MQSLIAETSGLRFQLSRLRMEFIARQPLYFPPVKAGNLLRGALGTVFTPEPVPTGPSGLSDPPRQFVLRVRHLNGRSFQPGESFHADVHVFWPDPTLIDSLTSAFETLAHEGLGPDRAALELYGAATEPLSLELCPAPYAPDKIRIDFLSPTELKHDRHLADHPEFPILFARIRDRISTLSATYGPGPLAIDFRGIACRAAEIRMTDCRIRYIPIERHSTRTSQVHSIGGFLGSAEYQGNLAEFLPYLEAAQWAGVGRHVVWGNGEVAVTAVP